MLMWLRRAHTEKRCTAEELYEWWYKLMEQNKSERDTFFSEVIKLATEVSHRPSLFHLPFALILTTFNRKEEGHQSLSRVPIGPNPLAWGLKIRIST